jgi:hypothetical protein
MGEDELALQFLRFPGRSRVGQLLAQGEVLQDEIRARAEGRAQRAKDA